MHTRSIIQSRLYIKDSLNLEFLLPPIHSPTLPDTSIRFISLQNYWCSPSHCYNIKTNNGTSGAVSWWHSSPDSTFAPMKLAGNSRTAAIIDMLWLNCLILMAPLCESTEWFREDIERFVKGLKCTSTMRLGERRRANRIWFECSRTEPQQTEKWNARSYQSDNFCHFPTQYIKSRRVMTHNREYSVSVITVWIVSCPFTNILILYLVDFQIFKEKIGSDMFLHTHNHQRYLDALSVLRFGWLNSTL